MLEVIPILILDGRLVARAPRRQFVERMYPGAVRGFLSGEHGKRQYQRRRGGTERRDKPSQEMRCKYKQINIDIS